MWDLPPFEPRESELLYAELADYLVRLIDDGTLRPGQRVPAERELAADLGVAYQTVRRAMGLLRERGLIKTIHGKGTFVAPERP